MKMAIALMTVGALSASNLCAADEAAKAWPAPVPGWKAPVAGEHPRLFFRKTSGADGLIVTVGLPMTGAKEVEAGGQTFHILLLGGKPAEPVALGDKVVVGKQEIGCDGKKIVFSVMAGPAKLPRMGCWK